MTDYTYHGRSCAHCQEIDRADSLLHDMAEALTKAHPQARVRFQNALQALLNDRIVTLTGRDVAKTTIVLDPPSADVSPFTGLSRD